MLPSVGGSQRPQGSSSVAARGEWASLRVRQWPIAEPQGVFGVAARGGYSRGLAHLTVSYLRRVSGGVGRAVRAAPLLRFVA